MKKLEKLKKNYVINTVYLDKKEFNEPIYLIDANKEFIKIYARNKKGILNIQELKLEDEFADKTFITLKEFFKKCEKDNTEYKIEKVENGDIYIRVCYYGDLSLFYKLSFKTMQANFILTNINKYKFYKTTNNITRALDKTNLSYLDKERIERYLSSIKNIKRDFIFTLKKSKEKLEKEIENQ